jgi:hypothetical protein
MDGQLWLGPSPRAVLNSAIKKAEMAILKERIDCKCSLLHRKEIRRCLGGFLC